MSSNLKPKGGGGRVGAVSAWSFLTKPVPSLQLTQFLLQIRRLVHIKVEGSDKASMVFKIITVILLPLSLVLTYFSMNTADVRNREQRR